MVATIEFIQQVISNYEQAAEANRKTPGREGNIVTLEPETVDDVMVTADLHGHRKNFNLIKKIAELDHYPKRHLILQEVCHGGPTYPSNGGCMSHALLEDVAKLKTLYPKRVHFILSNHELAEVTDYPIMKGKKMLNLSFRLGMQEMYGPAAEKVKAAACAFIKSCPLAVRLPHGVVACHTIPDSMASRRFDMGVFQRPLSAQDLKEGSALHHLLWGRDFSEENAKSFADRMDAHVLINGHEPCEEGFATPNDVQIILDCTGEKGTYLIVPADRPYTHEQLVARIRRLQG